VLDVGAGDQDVTVYGAEQNDTLGFNIGVADVTGDDTADLLVSARGGDGDNNRTQEAGELHILAGGSLPETIDLLDYPDDIYVYGADAADFLGNALGAADFDGDGANELFVGSPAGDGIANDPSTFRDGGEGFVLDPRGLSGAVRILDAPLKLAVYGAHSDDALGTSMAAGDMDGDGRPELVLLDDSPTGRTVPGRTPDDLRREALVRARAAVGTGVGPPLDTEDLLAVQRHVHGQTVRLATLGRVHHQQPGVIRDGEATDRRSGVYGRTVDGIKCPAAWPLPASRGRTGPGRVSTDHGITTALHPCFHLVAGDRRRQGAERRLDVPFLLPPRDCGRQLTHVGKARPR
jgi:hypothetical protein